MKKIKILMMMSFLFLSINAFGQNYGKEMKKEWQQLFGVSESQQGKYRWSGYPVDNFGVYTSYDPEDPDKWKDNDRICATWSCLNISYPTVDSLSITDRIRVSDNKGQFYADVGSGPGGTLDNEKSKKLALGLVIPNLMQILNINASLNWNSNVTASLKFTSGHLRSVDRDKFRVYLETSTNQSLRNAFAMGHLVYISNDIVLEGVEITLKVDKKKNLAVDDALTQAVSTVLSKDTALKFNWSSDGTGTYVLKIDHPVIVGVLARKQKSSGVLTADDKTFFDKVMPKPSFTDFLPSKKSVEN